MDPGEFASSAKRWRGKHKIKSSFQVLHTYRVFATAEYRANLGSWTLPAEFWNVPHLKALDVYFQWSFYGHFFLLIWSFCPVVTRVLTVHPQAGTGCFKGSELSPSCSQAGTGCFKESEPKLRKSRCIQTPPLRDKGSNCPLKRVEPLMGIFDSQHWFCASPTATAAAAAAAAATTTTTTTATTIDQLTLSP